MDKWMALAGAAVASLAGFTWLALAMQAHWKQVYGNTEAGQRTRLALRVLGAAGLLIAGTLCFAADRPSMAILVWLMLMASSAVAVTFTLSWKPQLLRFGCPMPAASSTGQ